MTTTLTPPPTPAPTPSGPPPAPGAAGRVIAILAIAVGAVLILGTVLTAVGSTLASALVRTETRTLTDATGLSDVDVDLAAGRLTVVFVDGIDGPELTVTSASGATDWTFAADGGTLTVASPDRRWGPAWWFGGVGTATLRLPADLQASGLDADFEASAGELTVSGRFASLEVGLGAGRLTVSGSADELGLDVSAGAADLDLSDVRTAEVSLSAGAADLRFTGAPPRSVSAEVSAGALRLTVPEGDYDVRSDVTAGQFDNAVTSRPGAPSTVSVRVSAGSATLTAR